MNIKQLKEAAKAARPYWIDTAVYFSPGLARAKNSTKWAAGTYALPQLPGMTCTAAAGFYRYTPDEVPTESVGDFKEPRISILAKHGIPVQAKAQDDPTVGIVARRYEERKAKAAEADEIARKVDQARVDAAVARTAGLPAPKISPWAEPMQPKVKAARKPIAPGKLSQLSFGF